MPCRPASWCSTMFGLRAAGQSGRQPNAGGGHRRRRLDRHRRAALQTSETPGEYLASERRLAIAVTPLDSAGGRIVLLHDVTETQHLKTQAERNQRLAAMGEMAAQLAHQLRTPLAAALLYAGNLENTELPAATRVSIAQKTVARLKHLERLIQDMLLFARGEALGRETFAVSRTAGELAQNFEPCWPRRASPAGDRRQMRAVRSREPQVAGQRPDQPAGKCPAGGRWDQRAHRAFRAARRSVAAAFGARQRARHGQGRPSRACSSPFSPPAAKAPASAWRSPAASCAPTAAASMSLQSRRRRRIHLQPAMSEKLNILVVEDDDALRDALQVTLETAGHDTDAPMAGRPPWKHWPARPTTWWCPTCA
jgi:hypothetical protein